MPNFIGMVLQNWQLEPEFGPLEQWLVINNFNKQAMDSKNLELLRWLDPTFCLMVVRYDFTLYTNYLIYISYEKVTY